MTSGDTTLRRRQYLALLGAVGTFTIAGRLTGGEHFERRTEFLPEGEETLPPYTDKAIDHYIREGQSGAWAPYVRIGQGAYEGSPSLVGTREQGAMERLVGHEDVSVSSTTFTPIATPFTYGYLESAPNRIPVLKVICVLQSATRGETLEVRVGTGTRGVDRPLMEFGTEQDTTQHWLYDEVYLNEVGEGTAAREPHTLSEGTYRVWARVSGGTGTVRAASTLILDWEII